MQTTSLVITIAFAALFLAGTVLAQTISGDSPQSFVFQAEPTAQVVPESAPKKFAHRVRDAGREVRAKFREALASADTEAGAAPVRPNAGQAAVVAQNAASPIPAQRRAMEAYATSQRAEVERSLVADLNGDGKGEVLAEINWFMGNSHFGWLVVFADNGRGLQPVARSEDALGQVQQVSVENGLIHV